MPDPASRSRVGSQRPGGRTASTRRAVLLAGQEDLILHGYARFSIGRVASRAGVNKTTIYRRWGCRENLIRDLLVTFAANTVPIPDTGHLESDLRAFANEITGVLNGRSGLMLRALVAAAAADQSVREQLNTFYEDRYALAEQIVVRAIDRAQLHRDVEPRKVIRILAGPLYYSWIILGQTPADEDASDATTAALSYAGQFSPDGWDGRHPSPR